MAGVVTVADPETIPQVVAAFYRRNLRAVQFGVAVAEVIIVPLLAFSALGQITIFEPLKSYVIVPAAMIETFNVGVLLIGGFLGPRASVPACPWCGGRQIPEVNAYECDSCHRRSERGPRPPSSSG